MKFDESINKAMADIGAPAQLMKEVIEEPSDYSKEEIKHAFDDLKEQFHNSTREHDIAERQLNAGLELEHGYTMEDLDERLEELVRYGS